MPEKAEEVVEQLSTSHLKLILGDSLLSWLLSGTAFWAPRFLKCKTWKQFQILYVHFSATKYISTIIQDQIKIVNHKCCTFLPMNFPPFSDFAAAAHLNNSFILDMVLILSPLTLSFFSLVLHWSFVPVEDDNIVSVLSGKTLFPAWLDESDLWTTTNPLAISSFFIFMDRAKCCLLWELLTLLK